MGAVETSPSLEGCQAGPGAMGAVVLAAGQSSRMGASKPLLPIGRAPALQRLVGE